MTTNGKKARLTPKPTQSSGTAPLPDPRDLGTVRKSLAKLAAVCPRIVPAFQKCQEARKKFGDGSPEYTAATEKLQAVINAETDRTDPAAVNLPLPDVTDPRADKAVRDAFHTDGVGGQVYSRLLSPMLEATWGKDSGEYNETIATTIQHLGDVLRQMAPHDPLEEMLITQAVWTHARIANLSIWRPTSPRPTTCASSTKPSTALPTSTAAKCSPWPSIGARRAPATPSPLSSRPTSPVSS